MKEQDTLLDNEGVQSSPRIMMSIETYEQMQKDPKVAKSIYTRIINKDKGTLYDTIEYLKKW
jgi:hypothetical protein